MIDDIEFIKSKAKKLNVQNLTYYKGNYGTGIVVDIINEWGHFKRVIQFSNEKELTEFLILYDYANHHKDVTLMLEDYYQNITPKSYKFIKNNQEYTYKMYLEDENLGKEKLNIEEYENDKNLNELQEYINEKFKKLYIPFKQYNKLFENIEKAEEILEKLKNNETVDLSVVKDLYINENVQGYNDNIKLNDYIYLETNIGEIQGRIFYKNNVNRLKMLLEQIEYLCHLSKFQRLFNKKSIQEKLIDIVNSYKILTKEELNELIQKENNYYEYLYKKTGKLNSNNVSLIKEIDKIEDFSEKIKYIDNYGEGKEDIKIKEEQKIQEKIDDSLDEHYPIYDDLLKQYEENFTEQEKKALLIYNSTAFPIINLVGTIPDYEKMALEQIKTIVNSEIYLEKKEFVKSTINKIFEQSKYRENELNILLNDFINGDYIKYSISILKIISNIKEKIFLPCDLVVYREVTTKPNAKLAKISDSRLMSTTLNPNASFKYSGKGQKNLIKINLKAGSPVTAIVSNTNNYILDYDANLNEDNKKRTPICELLFNMDDYIVDYENIYKDSIINFQLNNGEFVNSGSYLLYETSMQYKYESILKEEENKKR